MKDYESFLDALVGELPKFGSWPNGTRAARIDSNGEIIFIGRLNPRSGIFMKQISDWDSFVVSEAEYRAALADKCHAELPDKCENQTSDDEGWIAWGSGEPPLDGGEFVEVRVQMKGSTYVTRGKVYDFVWHRTSGCERYIIAYRQIKNPKHDVNKVNETPVGIAPGADGMLLSSTIDSSADNQMRIAKIIADELPELAASKLLRLVEVLNDQIEGNRK